LQVNLSRLIVYAESADTALQREVAEKLANEAVKASPYLNSVDRTGRKQIDAGGHRALDVENP
jgi:hypothetical protein